MQKNPVVALSDKLGGMVSASRGKSFEEIKAALAQRDIQVKAALDAQAEAAKEKAAA